MKEVMMYKTEDGKIFENPLDSLLYEFRLKILKDNTSYHLLGGATTEQVITSLKWVVTNHSDFLASLLEASSKVKPPEGKIPRTY